MKELRKISKAHEAYGHGSLCIVIFWLGISLVPENIEHMKIIENRLGFPKLKKNPPGSEYYPLFAVTGS